MLRRHEYIEYLWVKAGVDTNYSGADRSRFKKVVLRRALVTFTSEIAGAVCSSNRGDAIPIQGVRSWRVAGNHSHHGDRGLRGTLEHVDGLDLANATWN